MRVAVLLTGLDEQFPKIKNRVLNLFKCDGIEFNFFCHTWEEKVAPLDSFPKEWNDISAKLVKKNVPFPYNDNRIKNYKTSSFQEIYDRYISKDEEILRSQLILVFSYLAQDTSTVKAFEALNEYKTENDIEYDVVIKWRYDLLLEDDGKKNLNLFFNTENGKMYSSYVDKNQMNDFYYYAKYNTFEKFITNLQDEMYDKLLRLCKKPELGKIPYYLYHERMLLTSAMNIFSYNRFSEDIFQIGNLGRITIFREGCDRNATFSEILKYNETEWINKGWEKRIIND